ncbi:MAG: tyrosine--tRNA ligase [Planctomycetota bacterium]|nr:tyrosine--tRNA ligase [Planctomycetota bacterium]
MENILPELESRGLIEDCTDRDALGKLLASKRVTVYVGFDPTADSLHVGNLVPLLGLVRFQRAGHRPIAVAGGGTGLIGDPSGKATERALLDRDRLNANLAAIKAQLARFLDFESKTNPARMVDNADWLCRLDLIGFLRDVGKRFTVNAMIAKESVRSRMEDRESGISFTEFSYMLLQAYDFLHLYRTEGCELQAGGSDQWGNITAGIELIRKADGGAAYGLTFPLITTADGKKFGKTEAGTVWLDPRKTSPYRFYQYWMRVDDRDVVRFLNYFTFLNAEQVGELERSVRESPEKREAQATLAFEVTALVHGAEAARSARRASEVLFGGEVAGVSEADLAEIAGDMPATKVPEDFVAGDPPLVDALVRCGLCRSKGEARRDISGGGIYVNNVRARGEDAKLSPADALFGKYILLRKGKKTYHALVIE